MGQNKSENQIRNMSRKEWKYQDAVPKSTKSLGPSDQLIHATVQVSEGAAAPIKSTDQVQVPQGHEEHKINGAGCVSKQSGPQQVN